MNKVVRVVFFGWWLVVATVLCAESPFTITPRLQPANGGAELLVSFAVPTNHVLYAEKLRLEIAEQGDLRFTTPESYVIKDKFSGKEKKVFGETFTATCTLPELPQSELTLKVHFQGCDPANCFFPEDRTFKISPNGTVARLDEESDAAPAQVGSAEWRDLATGFSVANRGSGYLNEKAFLGFLDTAQSGTLGVAAAETGSGFWSMLTTMTLIVLGGAALNLTPCILPMIPINLAIIGAGAQAGSKKRGFALGATYAAGMAVAYGVLGLVVVLTGSKFGTLNSSPWFNLGIAIVFLVLALGMFDLLSIDLSRFQSGSGGGAAASKSKFVVAYTMGTVAALLAGACVAPVVISVLVQATALHAKGVIIGLLLPFLLGIGMGLPWPFAGAGLSFLPKPGKWMLRVKYAFGVLIIGFAAYYGHLSFGIFRTEATLLAHAAEDRTTANSTDTLAEDLSKALRDAQADGRPVFIDFWASWCKNCSAMEHTTFAAASVKERLAAFHVVRFQAERPNQSPAKEVLDCFNVLGLPSYVVLLPNRPAAAGGVRQAVEAQP
jgi:thiol:disulfide interchange protein